MRLILFVFFLIVFGGWANATSYPSVSTQEAADVIVVFVPSEKHAFDMASENERAIIGRVISVGKGQLGQGQFVHLAHTFTSPLEPGIPVTLFLKKHPERDVYYLIGVGSPNDRAQGQPK